MKEKILILIDGSNFYFKLKDLGLHDLLHFDFEKFSKFLAKSGKIIGARYYVGRIRQDGTQKSQKLFTAQQKLIGRLKKSKYRYCLGYCDKRSCRCYL